MTDLAARLRAHFDCVAARMADLPVCNPRLAVAIAGPRSTGMWSLAVVSTPWVMKLLACPADATLLPQPGSSLELTLPAGPVTFTVETLGDLGPLGAVSLFSPMDDFTDQDAAIAVATATLDQLLTPPAPLLDRPLDRRGLLFGRRRPEARP